ncbi:hypothetical protein [Enterovibrio coralii]|uniref:MotY N-terminal domain-containing protein n=1 Tax=Enterovibrio coralii TaxID=294935 RepID=A0A135I6L2_9GAMM|nr:hypothetical protein [Enterovibrio coralii]KXF81090.1 hypothetical protein ATN88_19195 [Enterovibrio coralii]
MDISSWFYQGEWYECSLSHAETKYGKFYFRSLPGNKISFEIQTKENNTYHGTNLYTISPPWKNLAEKRFISASAAKNGSGHYVFSQGIKELVNHVANGEWIQVSFQNQQAPALNLVIPSIRVRDAVTAFSSCTAKLPEMAYEDARTLELTFAHGQSVLLQEQKNILSAFRSYVVLDPSVEKVLIDGHTDAIGSRVANLKTSQSACG